MFPAQQHEVSQRVGKPSKVSGRTSRITVAMIFSLNTFRTKDFHFQQLQKGTSINCRCNYKSRMREGRQGLPDQESATSDSEQMKVLVLISVSCWGCPPWHGWQEGTLGSSTGASGTRAIRLLRCDGLSAASTSAYFRLPCVSLTDRACTESP